MYWSLARAGMALALSLLALLPAHAREKASRMEQMRTATRVLTTQFTYTVGITQLPAGTQELHIWIPLPSDSPWQSVRDVRVEGVDSYRITRESRYGNRMVYVHQEKPTSPLTFTVQFVVHRKEVSVLSGNANTETLPARGREELERYLQPDRNVPLGGRYEAIARQVAGDQATPLDKARALFEHVVATMQYDYKKESPKLGEGDVAFVCDYKKGNCSDLHSYLISLARNLKIPAYLEYGFPLTGIPLANPLPVEGTISGYHCWTWIHDPAHGWLPLDASDARRWLDAKQPQVKERLFGNLILERSAVAFSRGRDLTLEPAQKAGPLNYFIYPYAEADGQPVKTSWELRYRLVEPADAASATHMSPSHEDLQRQIDELRQIVREQAQELKRLREQTTGRTADKAAPPATPVTAASRGQIGFYGFLRLDTIVDSAQTNNSQTPFFVQSPSNANVAGRHNSTFSLHPRLTRLGWNFAAPPDLIKGMKVGGKFEMDWQNGQGLTSESRPLPRIRHAFLQLQRASSTWLFGQTWDLISPLFPSPNDDTLQWNAGNLGDRRPQIRFTHEPAASPFSIALALGLTGAVDAKDLDANGIRDGEDSAVPHVQMRLGWKEKSTEVGLWGHYAWEALTKAVAGRREFKSYSIGTDLLYRPGPRWDLRGELWLGSNLSDFRGGIGQGINTAMGAEIRSHGGWLEVGYQPRSNYRVAVGYTEDNPLDKDVPSGGRQKNYSIFLHNRWRLSENVEVGANYLYWLTRWKGLAQGIDHRFNAFVQRNF